MGQVSWRADDELLARVRAAAQEHGWSLNMFVTRVMDAATDPEHAPPGAERIRERLARAGLLAEAGPPVVRPAKAAVRRAGKAAAGGTTLAELVSAGRE
jgi:hypothetical protein